MVHPPKEELEAIHLDSEELFDLQKIESNTDLVVSVHLLDEEAKS